MKRTFKAIRQPFERGSVAIETAIALPLLLIFIALPSILFAFYFRQYSAAQKAAHDAAIYLSTAPRAEMTMTGPDGNFAALTVAKKIVEKELAGIVPDGVSVEPAIYCIYKVGTGTPTKPCTPAIFRLDTHTLYRFDVGINVSYINPMTGSEVSAWYMAILSSVRYLGN